MAPTEGRVARPERRWVCRRGTPSQQLKRVQNNCMGYSFCSTVFCLLNFYAKNVVYRRANKNLV